MTLEFTGLRVINVENMGEANRAGSGADPRKVDLRDALGSPNKGTKKDLRNVGPSVSYKLRDAAGQAREYNNYMLPVDMGDGVPLFLLGVRDTPAEAFRYLRVPADDKGSIDGFVRLKAALADPAARAEAVRRYAAKAVDPSKRSVSEQLAGSAGQALALYAGDAAAGGKGAGRAAVSDYLEARVPAAERDRAGEVVIRILGGVLFELAQLTREQAGLPPLDNTESTQAFMAQAVVALSDAFLYPAPMAFQLKDFQQVQASVFQVTRSPGHYIVYLGCALLIVGVFAMLYVRERRLWVWLGPKPGGSAATMALSSNRQTMETDREFERLKLLVLGKP
jgi:cytochrome c biogenesis protein